MKIEKRYLVVPVSRYAGNKRLVFSDEKGIVMDYMVQLCTGDPEDYYYIDMRYALGRELNYACEPATAYVPEFTDTLPTEGLYQEKYRPAAHFTTARGWVNDPNGLVYADGVYHLFYQHNPAGPNWGNMHWGHAVSRDLLHWEEKEIALFPDEWGTMFSGSAIVDTENRTGLKGNENDVILLYYTACPAGMKLSGEKETSQCLAYSTDGGETFRKYAGNPIIPHIIGGNRDPKVVYAEEEGCYYMALFLDVHVFALFTSDDLLHWEQVQIFTMPNDDECPNFYPLKTPEGKRYWVFAGAHDTYLIGELKDRKFVPVQESVRLHYGNKSYAAQTYSGIPDDRIVRFGWNQAAYPGAYFNCAMTTPNEMTLLEEKGKIYLCINPIAAYSELAKPVSPENLTGRAHDITLKLKLDADARLKVSFLGFELQILAEQHLIRVQNFDIPLYDKDGAAELRFISDTTSVEVYSTCGKAFGVFENFADYDLNRVTVETLAGQAEVQVEASELENIWGGKA